MYNIETGISQKKRGVLIGLFIVIVLGVFIAVGSFFYSQDDYSLSSAENTSHEAEVDPVSELSVQPGEKTQCKAGMGEYGNCNCEKKIKVRTHLKDDCEVWDEELACTDMELEQCSQY